MFLEHLEPGKEFGARLFGQIDHPLPNRQSLVIFLEEIDAPAGRVFQHHIDSLSKMISERAIIISDRSCLALAIALGAPVYTTEQLWKNLKLGVPIHVIR